MNFPISFFSFVKFFFISFKAILLGIYTLLLFSDGSLRNYNMHPDLPKSDITWYLYPLLKKLQEFRDLKTISILYIPLDYIATIVVYFNLDIFYIPQVIYYCFHCSSFLPTSSDLLFWDLFSSA